MPHAGPRSLMTRCLPAMYNDFRNMAGEGRKASFVILPVIYPICAAQMATFRASIQEEDARGFCGGSGAAPGKVGRGAGVGPSNKSRGGLREATPRGVSRHMYMGNMRGIKILDGQVLVFRGAAGRKPILDAMEVEGHRARVE